jgi:23S rRNA (adenine2030-N6)-methyltransferase
LQRYARRLEEYRALQGSRRVYPGSPLIAASELRPQDRAVLVELVPAEARALETAVGHNPQMRVEQGDGFDRLRAWLPPAERRGLTFIDPPYEETARDFERVTGAIVEALRRFQTGVIAAWYPIKDERDIAAWQAGLVQTLGGSANRRPAARGPANQGPADRCEALAAELWLYPRDSRVGLNGSGLLIVNPPYLLAERMRVWLPELQAQLDAGRAGGTSIRLLAPSPGA